MARVAMNVDADLVLPRWANHVVFRTSVRVARREFSMKNQQVPELGVTYRPVAHGL